MELNVHQLEGKTLKRKRNGDSYIKKISAIYLKRMEM